MSTYLLTIILSLFLAFSKSSIASGSETVSDVAPTSVQNTLVLHPGNDEFSAKGHIGYLEDSEQRLILQDILTPEIQSQFNYDRSDISMGYSKSAFWFRLNLRNDYPLSSNSNLSSLKGSVDYMTLGHDQVLPSNLWSLEIASPIIDYLEIYYVLGDQTIRLDLGDSRPFSQRPIPLSSFVVPFTLNPGENAEIYIRMKTSRSVRLPITIRTIERTVSYFKDYQIGYGIYFGIIIASFLYNLFMFLYLRDRSYLFYLSCIASFAFVIGSVMGFGQDYLWRPYPWLTNYIIVESIVCYGIFALLFSQSFLHTKKHTPRLHVVINALVVFGVVIGLMGLLIPYSTSVRLVALFTVLHTIVILTSGVITLFKGVKEAKYFVLAWSTVLIGVSMFALLSNGLVPANFFTYYSAQFGSAMEVVLLSLALADRLRQSEHDKIRLEREARNALKQANEELSVALEKLKQNNKLKDEFLATISHELRTPMNGVEGALELADNEANPQKAKRHLKVAMESAKGMTHLVDTILEYSEIQAGKTLIERQNICLLEIINPITTQAESACIEKSINFEFNLDKEIANTVEADGRALSVVLTHLLDNAVKFTADGGVKLSVTVDKHDLENPILVFSVFDTGIGVPKEALKDIFTPFQQLDGSFSRGYGGLGIGLSICNELAIKMQGQLSVYKNHPSGSEFRLAIPYLAVNTVASVTYYSNDSNDRKNSRRILVVEDNLVNQKILVAILKSLDHQVLVANDGIEALAVLSKEPVSLIFMDCQMPCMDGFETTRRIRESVSFDSKIPIVAVTANAMSGDKTRCLDAGMNDYVKKPINRSTVENKIMQWCG
ncbi:MAG: response regulator [Pseudomonadales bacterium]|nr:response regulator [Pseudomonadales bacterium]